MNKAELLVKFQAAIESQGFDDVGEFVELIGGVMGMINLNDLENARKISDKFAVQIGHILTEIGYIDREIDGKTMKQYYDDQQENLKPVVLEDILFDDLLGVHKFSGIQFTSYRDEGCYCEGANINCCLFKLDGNVYVAAEDPEDGYRSCLNGVYRTRDMKLETEFEPINICGHIFGEQDGHKCDIMELIDIKTGKAVLEFGTDYTDDYYPCYVATFYPENMSLNKDVEL